MDDFTPCDVNLDITAYIKNIVVLTLKIIVFYVCNMKITGKTKENVIT